MYIWIVKQYMSEIASGRQPHANAGEKKRLVDAGHAGGIKGLR